MRCGICENDSGNKEFKVKEMLFGLRDEFLYFECSRCGCLQIAQIPPDMSKYYPSNYLSFRDAKPNFFRMFFKKRANEYVMFKKGLTGRIVYKKCFSRPLDIISKTGIDCDARILDVGCGRGNTLYRLNEIGFKNLVGIDPYVGSETVTQEIKILKTTIDKLPDNQKFDLIIFDHTLEHIAQQAETLLRASKLLAENSMCLVRIPLKTEHIWRLYGTDWVQIDAPRHFFIHTPQSFEFLAKRCGLAILNVIFDSTEMQFWGSEQYKRGIPYLAEESYCVNPRRSIFSARQIKQYKKMARQLNTDEQGDQASFYLVKS